MYNAALAKLKAQLVDKRAALRVKYDNALPEREYLIQVGQVRELNWLIKEIEAALHEPEDKDDGPA